MYSRGNGSLYGERDRAVPYVRLVCGNIGFPNDKMPSDTVKVSDGIFNPIQASAAVFQTTVQLLDAVHAQMVAAFRTFAHRFAAGSSGVLRHALLQCALADDVAVGHGLRIAGNGIHDQCDFTIFQRVADVRAAFGDFIDGLYNQPLFGQVLRRAACGADAVA